MTRKTKTHLLIVDNRLTQNESEPTYSGIENASCGENVHKRDIAAWVTKFSPTEYGEVLGSKPTCKECDRIRVYPSLSREHGV